VVDGGFDPVPIVANAGDVISVEVKNASGVVLVQLSTTVMPTRPPVVVRAYPPPKKRDVPLNTAIVVVFSEPVEPSTLTRSSIALHRGADAVGGTVSLLDGSQTIAVFRPNDQLAPNTDYRLVVTDAVTDLDGTPLAEGVTVDFTTGQSLSGPAASIQISPDTVYLTQSMTYQLTATARDASGNILVNLPLSWASNDTNGLSVSAKGRVTALAPGFYVVSAGLNNVLGFARVIVKPGTPATLTIAPSDATVGAAGDTIILTTTVRDSYGRSIRYPDVSWTSSTPTAATVARYDPGDGRVGLGIVKGIDLGTTMITARSGSVADSIAVGVVSPPAVASVTITAPKSYVLLGYSVPLSATTHDARGRVLIGRAITWTVDNTANASVDSNGSVLGLVGGVVNVIATSEGVSDTVSISVIALRVRSIVAGELHTCGITTDSTAYCWGSNDFGQLGDSTNRPQLVAVPVNGGIHFSALSTSAYHSCGLDGDGNGYCWGHNNSGELGSGSIGDRWTPVGASGGFVFRILNAGWLHTCGLSSVGAAYCWGYNRFNQVGDGTATDRHVPVAVVGGLTFNSLSTWGHHTCGLDVGGGAYCWGFNQHGQLGTGTNSNSSAPIAVLGALSFTSIVSGWAQTCGLVNDGTAYCWGFNSVGQLGDGTTTDRNVPVPVSGGLHFVSIATGESHTCALTADGKAYCWGWNNDGQLGDGSTQSSTTPVAVAGNYQFSSITTGGFHTCALAADGVAYCWGYNLFAQLGDGTTTSSSVPVRVAGQP
jgi:alpha-tubulin suppressor-like RCC1 family protein